MTGPFATAINIAIDDALEVNRQPPAENPPIKAGSELGFKRSGRKMAPAFSITRRAILILLEAKANAYQICVYLVIAQFTDASGRYSVSGPNALSKYLSASKAANHPIERALRSLQGETVAGMPQLKRLLTSREEWIESHKGDLPDGSTARSKIRYIVDRNSDDELVWISSALVLGIKPSEKQATFSRPLAVVKALGDLVARVLLYLYHSDDIRGWHGIAPHAALCRRYRKVRETVNLKDGGTFICEAMEEIFISPQMIEAAVKTDVASSANSMANQEEVLKAISALITNGFIYEVVMVLDRDRDLGENWESSIRSDASPLYALDTKSLHGYKPIDEEGLAGVTAKLADIIRRSIADKNGVFDGTYAATLPPSQKGMIAGIFRIRFRAANPKLPGIAQAWAEIREKDGRASLYLDKLFNGYCKPSPRRPGDVRSRKARSLQPLPDQQRPAHVVSE